jgi:hypothetical protein
MPLAFLGFYLKYITYRGRVIAILYGMVLRAILVLRFAVMHY